MSFSDMHKDYSHCYGCGLCTLVCPVWHQSQDIFSTPHGQAKALQAGADIQVESLFECILCGACESVCPENIGLLQMLIELRRNATVNQNENIDTIQNKSSSSLKINYQGNSVLLADNSLLEQSSLLNQTLGLLNNLKLGQVIQAKDNGNDITHALQAGFEISAQRLEIFLTSIKTAKNIIVSEGLLKIALKKWLPKKNIMSLGYALSHYPDIEKKLGINDIYIIESRAYNADFKQMVTHYDQLKRRSGCQLNLDLQRLAMPTGGIKLETKCISAKFDPQKQSKWILQGKNIERIIVEHIDDGTMLAQVTDKPVIHLAEFLAS